MAEQTALLGYSSDDEKQVVRKAVEQHRSDCCSQIRDTVDSMSAATFRAEKHVVSHPAVLAALLFSSRMAFIYDLASDGLVAAALFASGNPYWGGCVVGFMVLPYIVMMVALFQKALQRMAQMTSLPQCMTGTAWLFGGPVACLVADMYLCIRYAGCEPDSVEVFHYMTLREMAEFLEAQSQLILQSYIAFRQLNPWQLFPPVEGAQRVNPVLLALSVGISLYTAYSIYSKLRVFAANQSGGSMQRFLWHMSQLGDGLAPSNLFDQLRRHRRVVITYDLSNIAFREMERLSVVAKRAHQLEELVIEDGRWVAALTAHGRREEVAGRVVKRFASSPYLRRLEVWSSEPIPKWAFDDISKVAKSHRCLRFAIVHGHEPIMGAYMQRLPDAHRLLKAAEQGDTDEVSRSGGAPLDIHADALALAASRNSIRLLRALLLHQGGLDAVTRSGGAERGLDSVGDGATPLHFAAASGSHHALELLLVARAEVDSPDKKGFTPLHKAAREDSVKSINALLRGRADVDKSANDGETALLLATRESNTLSVNSLIVAKADTNKAERRGATPLYMAAQSDAADCLRLLLQARGDPKTASNTGITPLYSAAEHNSAECLKILLGNRADVHHANYGGATPLYIAASNDNTECLKLLLRERANINKPGNGGASPLYIAAHNNCSDCLQLLLYHRADIHQAEEAGCSPLYIAACNNCSDCLKLLLCHRADVDQAERGGASPLRVAAAKNNAECLHLLLQHRADVHQKCGDGVTPLLAAVQIGSVGCVKSLLYARADPSDKWKRWTAAGLARREGHEVVAAALQDFSPGRL